VVRLDAAVIEPGRGRVNSHYPLFFVFLLVACSSSPLKVDDGLRSVVRDGGSAVVDAGLDAGVEPPVRLRDRELASFLVDRRTYLGDAGPPPVGSTSSGVRIPFERYLIPLAEGSKGDTASLFQIRAVDVADGGMRVRVAVAGGTVVSPDMVPGEASTVTVPFSTADSGASFDLDFPDFIATAQQDLPFTPTAVEPNLTVFSIPGYRRIGVVLTGWYGNLTAMSVVQTATIRPDLPPQRVTLDWVDLFAEENLATRVLARLRVPLRGPTFNSSFELVSHRFSPLFKGVPVDVRGVMSAPRNLRLDGQPAVARSGVGLTPTLSWTPPARGNPVAYDVRVWAFAPNTLPQGVAVFRTTQTRLTLPPSTLTAGTVYGLEIIALAGSYEPLRPRFLPPDSTVSSSITELFLP
jgi:hypothetical protein